MRHLRTTLFLLCCLLTAAAHAQSGPDTLWTHTYGGSGNDWCYAVRQTSDEGFIFAGQSNSISSQYDVYLVRTNCDGDTLWTRRFGGSGNDGARAICETTDGGFIVAGSTVSYGAGLSDVYLLRLTSTGDTVWTRAFGGAAGDYGRAVVQAADGGFVVAGITASFGAGGSDAYLLKTNAQGTLLWSRTYGTAQADEGRGLARTLDNGYLLAGSTWSAGGSWSDALLIRTDSNGDTLWMHTYGGADQDWFNAVSPTADGGFIAAGQSWLPEATNPDIYLLKLNSSGTTQWTRLLSGPGADEANAVIQASDGGFFAAGYTAPTGGSTTDCYIVKTDSTGQQEWARVYGGSQADVAWDAIQTMNDGFVVCGETNSIGHGNYDYYVVATGAAALPGDTIRDLRIHYDPDGAGLELRWTIPRPGTYDIFSTTDANAPDNLADPAWTLEASVRYTSPVAVWTDPDPLTDKKFYLVSRYYGMLYSRSHQPRHTPVDH
jgi:hypothetical protein